MNFNHDTGLIDTILTIDTTIAPPLGGTTGILSVVGTGGIQLPVGTTAQQPANSAGLIRYNSTTNGIEFNNGTSWSGAGGSVTSVSATGSTGLTVGGSPITGSGTLTFTLGTELQGLSGVATNGLVTRTAAGTYTGRTITGTASNIVVTNGDGVAGAPTINLATAGTAVTAQFVAITTDAYGRVTATTAATSGNITTALGYTPVSKAGDSMNSAANLTFSGGGTVTGLPTTPVGSTDAASKAYVDSLAQGLDPKGSVRAATTAAGTLATSFANGSVIDGVTLATNDRILIKNQAAPADNGIYTVNASGAPTRATDANLWTELPGAFTFVEEGTSLADTGWVCTSNAGGTLGTTAVTFVQFSGTGSYTAGTGLTLSGTQFSITSPIATSIGGTGLSSIGTASQILGVNTGATGLEYKTVTAGTAISVTPAAGTITIANTGVTSAVAGTGISVSGATGAVTIDNTGVTGITGTANQITASASTGSVTLSLPSAVTLGTSLTVSGLTANSFLYSGTAGLLTTTTAPTNGQLLIGSTGSAPVKATLTQGTGITVTNAAGSITIANAGVTSFTQTVPSIMSISGASTATGAVSSAISLATQTANTFFAGPTSSSAVPTFRAITLGDLPIKLYGESSSAPTAPSATGTNSIAIGSGSAASGAGSVATGDGTSASIYGAKVYANGKFATAGDAQSGLYVLRNITSSATATELFLDGVTGTQRLVVPNNSLWTFDILVAARRTDTTGGGAGYRFTGVLRKDATAATITFIGTPSKQILGETNTAWDVALTADTTNGSVKLSVTGEAAKTIRWVATVVTSEVTN